MIHGCIKLGILTSFLHLVCPLSIRCRLSVSGVVFQRRLLQFSAASGPEQKPGGSVWRGRHSEGHTLANTFTVHEGSFVYWSSFQTWTQNVWTQVFRCLTQLEIVWVRHYESVWRTAGTWGEYASGRSWRLNSVGEMCFFLFTTHQNRPISLKALKSLSFPVDIFVSVMNVRGSFYHPIYILCLFQFCIRHFSCCIFSHGHTLTFYQGAVLKIYKKYPLQLNQTFVSIPPVSCICNLHIQTW